MTLAPPLPDDLKQRLLRALHLHRRGELQAAAVLYRNLIKDHPGCSDALYLLGGLNCDAGALDAGIELIRRALSIEDSNADIHYSLATALLRQGNSAAAMESLQRVLALRPEFADAWFIKGNLLQGADRLSEAVASYRRALQLRPAFPEACNNLAAVQRALRQLPAALESVDRALAARPAYSKALNNRGLILLDYRRGAEAVEDFRRAVILEGRFAEAWHNLGVALLQLRRFPEARDAFAQLAEIAPDFPHLAGNLLTAKLNCCDWRDLDRDIETVVGAVKRGEDAAVPLALLCISGSATLQLRCAQRYTDAHYPPRPLAAGPRTAREKICVAYLSGDLGEHAVSYLLGGVFERHDAGRFDTIALSWGRREDKAARGRLEVAFSRFIDITESSDAQVVETMRRLEVDIAVDLTGHTLGQRTAILACRAAPVQVNFLGLPATMGASYVDYLIADRFVVPEEQRQHYAEQIVWLPDVFQPNDDRRTFATPGLPRGALGLPPGGFVFCSFNRNNKLSPALFDVWMRLVLAVPHSVLWLLASHPKVEENLRREAARRGVAADRLVFARDAPYQEYLARYAAVDLFLDTAPFNGGATVSDALSMGVPVLTCCGESFAARMAGSLLTSLGLAEVVTASMEEYEAAALWLAKHPGQLKVLRDRLAQARARHAVFDTDRYRFHLETAYQMMWDLHRQGLAPSPIHVPPREVR